jgi:hypothetical protein
VNRTRIERRWSHAARLGVIGASCLAGGAWLASGPLGVFAIMPLALGAASLVQAVRTTGEADCPGCGAKLDELRLRDNDGILCRACRRFVEGTGGELWLTDERRVSPIAIFGAEMPVSRRPEFPPFCPVCMEPSTRTIKVGANVSRGRYHHESYSYDMPACAEHFDGARVIVRSPFRFAFRSYVYQRAFCEANGVAPAQLV